jgi:hypothetical protein
MGKSSGKTFLSIVGFAFGALNPGFFGLNSGAWLAGGIYGAALTSNIWSATHQQENSSSAKFDAKANTVSSDSMIPVIYGTRLSHQLFFRTMAHKPYK